MRFCYSVLVFLVLSVTVIPCVFAQKNSCVNCHSRLEPGSPAERAYTDWKGSVHETAGVTCERCHGGDAAEPGRNRAHGGMRGPAEPGSRVHSSHILRLCGACHEPQLHEFTRSKHYKVLSSASREVQGPTCITCHGSMHTAVLAPDNVAAACRHCHNPESGISPNVPEEAHATLDLIFFAKNTVKWSGEFVNLARKQGFPATKAAEALKHAEEKFHLSEIKWHSFDFHEILNLVDESYESAKEAKRLADIEVTQGTLDKISKQKQDR